MNNTYKVNDSKMSKDFSKNTFSDFNKNEVIKLFENNLVLSKLHDSCYSAIELHVSLQNDKILETVLYIASLYTNIDYPKLPNVLFELYTKYESCMKQYNGKNLPDNRNNQEIRNIISYITSIVCLSPKNNFFQLGLLTKINEYEFDINIIKKNIKTTDLELTKDIFFEDESKELVIALNEIAYLLKTSNDTTKDILYWISWIIELEKRKKKDKLSFSIHIRKITNISEKLTQMWEWILWNIFLKEAHFRNIPELYQQIYSLYNFYKFNFKKTARTKYLIYIYHAIYLFKKKFDWDVLPLTDKYHLILQSNLSNNEFYKITFEKTGKKYYLDTPIDEKESDSNVSSKGKKPDKPKKPKKLKKKDIKAIKDENIEKRMSYLFE
jgi:hypothetical protein